MQQSNQRTHSGLDAVSALRALDPGVDRATWVRILMAAKAADISLDEAIEWSSRADNFNGAGAVKSVWKSLQAEGGISAGTLFHLAREAGWAAGSPALTQRRTAGSDFQKQAPSARHGPDTQADAMWKSFQPAPANHPYVVAKQGTPTGLRVVPESCKQVVAGQFLAGCLAVPVRPLGSTTLCSIQFIPPPKSGKKLNLPGSSMQGNFVVGDLTGQSTRIYVVEGIGQAWACSGTTGCASVIAFGSNREKFVSIIAGLRSNYPKSLPVLVADRGKELLAEEVALATNISFVCMPEDWPSNSDVNDIWLKHGSEAVTALLSNLITPPQRYKLLSGSDVLALPTLRWCVRDVLPAEGIAAVFGTSGAGKSFLVLDLAAAIAEGKTWFNHRVRSTLVVYVALEGQAGFQLRARAWIKHHGRQLPEGIRFVFQTFDLTKNSDVVDLAQAVRSVGSNAVVVLDTLNAAAPTVDENASSGMGAVLQAAKELQQRCAGLILLVHHSGKEVTRGLRGHSSLVAALDASIEVTRESNVRQWRVAKAKDGADDQSSRFELKLIDLGTDDDGEALSSCAIVHTGTGETSPPRLQIGGGTHQRVALDVLRPMLREASDNGMASAPPGRPCLELKVAIAAVGSRLVCDAGRRTERAGQAISGLVAKGALAHDSGWLWLP